MRIHRCLKCMTPLPEGIQTCPVCGRVYGNWAWESIALRPGTILDGKYLVGEMLGRGGFGITYLGFDLLLEQKVAIKEYFPLSAGLVTRENGSTVVWHTTMLEKTCTEQGFSSFLKEARKMAKLGGIPGVVGVKSVFIENETAYIVMDYVEGETLQRKLEREGPMDFDTCVRLLTPVIQALGQVHSHGIVHRDISPDNLMVRPDGQLVLLDLGAAKDLELRKSDGTVQSSQLVAKHGFSPIEQYSQTGHIGPWTDVYAMAATIYYCCTGKIPAPAVERMEEDTLACRPNLTQAQFQRLSPALNLFAKSRIQTMEDLLQALTPRHSPPKKPEPKKPEPKQPKEPKKAPEPKAPKSPGKRPPWDIIALVALALLLMIPIGGKKQKDTPPEPPAQIQALPTEAPVPTTEAPIPTTEATIPAQKTHTMAVMQAPEGETDEQLAASPFWGQKTYVRSEVERVVFQSTLKDVGANAWDVSADGDKSVLAWMENGTLHVAADGNIAPNPDASCLFYRFGNLKEIDFGDCFDTSQVTSMWTMFYKCSNLTSLDVSGFDTAKVTNMGYMFTDCIALEELDVSGFKTGKVTDMGHMFNKCISLETLDVSGFDTGNVATMSAMFLNCEALKALDVSGFKTGKVTDMAFMFSQCISLETLDVSGFDTGNVATMRAMFQCCEALKALDVSGFKTGKVTDMRAMFLNCEALKALDVSGFDTGNVATMRAMFQNCKALKALDVSGFKTGKVTDMGYMFNKCISLETLDVSGFDTGNVATMRAMFQCCEALKALDASGFKTGKVTDMSYMFSRCKSLETLDVSGFNTSNVTDMGHMFSRCDNLVNFKCKDAKLKEAFQNR